MAPQVARSSTTLTCPLYACSFDPKDADQLIVGGGGGAGSFGIGNKIVSDSSSFSYFSCFSCLSCLSCCSSAVSKARPLS
jgi:hypothetical protein